MVFRKETLYHEVTETLDTKNIDTSTTGYTLEPGIDEISDVILMIKNFLQDDVKVNITVDDITLKSHLDNNKTIMFTENCFLFYTLLGFTH